MAINDSEILRSSTLDLTSLRTKNARIERLYDSRNITPSDTKRVNDDLKKYIEYIAADFDSDNAIRNYDSDVFGIPANWSRTNNLYAGVDDGTGWAGLRAILDKNDNSFVDSGGNAYAGAPQVIVTADSESNITFRSMHTLLKAHLIDFIKNDKAVQNQLEETLAYLSADSDQFPKLSKKITTAYEDDPAGLTDLLQLITNFLRTNTNVNTDFAFNQTAPLDFSITSPFTTDSDPDAFLRGQRWYVRRKLGQVVVDALQFDSEFGGGNNRRFGKNELLNRLNLSLGLHNRRNFSSQFLLLGANFFNIFDFQWTQRDSDGAGNLTDSDSRGYSLGINNDIARVAGDRFAAGDFLDDSETILSYVKRIELFGNFWSRRLGAVDSETVQKMHDSEYMNKRSPAGRLTNYYNYHPSFKNRLHRENERFIDRILIRGYLTNKDDSDSQITHRRRLLNPLLQTFEVSDSETNRLWNSLINFADSDSDVVSRLSNTILDRLVPDSDNEDVLSVDSDLRARWGNFITSFVGDEFLDSEEAGNMIEELSIDSEDALILINANSVDSEEAIKLIQQYSPDSDEVIKLVNQYATDSDEVIKLINQYAVDSEESLKLINANSLDSDEAIRLITGLSVDSEGALTIVINNSVDSEDTIKLIQSLSVDSDEALILINDNSIDSEEALILINDNSIDSEEALILINNNSLDSEEALILINNNSIDSEDLKRSFELKDFLLTSHLNKIDSDSDRQTLVNKFVRETNEKIGNESIRNDFAKSIQPSFKIATQEHIVHDSESSYTVFTFTVPSKYQLPIDSEEVKIYINGVKLAMHNSYNKAGNALVNHSVDTTDISLLTSPNRIQVTFTNNLSQLDLLTIEYLTVLA